MQLSRAYDRLTAQERAALYLQARKRRDQKEADQLLATCPRLLIETRDPAFVAAISGEDVADLLDARIPVSKGACLRCIERERQDAERKRVEQESNEQFRHHMKETLTPERREVISALVHVLYAESGETARRVIAAVRGESPSPNGKPPAEP